MKVSELLFKIKNLLEGNLDLRDIWLEGQLSQPKFYNQTIYFNIKDEQTDSILGCFVGRDYFQKVLNKLEWKDGIKLKIYGFISVWNKQGTFKFIVQDAEKDDGLGQKFIELENLKKKLLSEGLFDSKYKKKIPLYPEKVGIITSLNGAAIHDIFKTMKNNGSLVELIIFPSLVQGDAAPESLVNALLEADDWGLDLMILTRGGGSFEDLYCFNNEQLARTIFQLKTPIISAVGHETDITIADYVADLRASTPTQSINELPNFYQEQERLISIQEQLIQIFNERIQKNLLDLSNYNDFIHLKIQNLIQQSQKDIDSFVNQLELQIKNQIQLNQNFLTTLHSELFNILQITFQKSYNQLDFFQNHIKDFAISIISIHKKEIDKFHEDLNIYQFFNDLKSQENFLQQIQNSLQIHLENTLISNKQSIENHINNTCYFMQNISKNEWEKLKALETEINHFIFSILSNEKSQLKNIVLELDSHNHTKILEKGYSITLKEGKILKSIQEIQNEDTIQTFLKDGSFESIVKKI